MRNFKDLIIWEQSMDLAVQCYRMTESFPRSERFGLTSQIQRSAVSIPSNIAEGCGRDTPRDFAKFLRYAYGSGCELETQIEIASMLKYGDQRKLAALRDMTDETRRMIYAFSKSLSEI